MISGSFELVSGWPVPHIRVLVLLPGISTGWASVNFLLDTGCSHTMLQPRDAVARIGIQRERLQQPALRPRAIRGEGIGGSASMFPVPVHYRLIDDQGFSEDIAGEILVAQLTTANEGLPSLLGWDVLEHFEILLNRRSEAVVLRRM